MLERTQGDARAAEFAAALSALLLAGGALNGFAVRIAETWQSAGQAGGAVSLFFGVSPFEVVAAAVGLFLLMQPGAETKTPRLLIWPEALLLAGLLVPSSTVSWVCTGLYAGQLALRGQGAFRQGAGLFVLLALAALWSSVGLRWFALAITSIEAQIIWLGLSQLRDDIGQTGNVIGVAGGHQLIILAACSSASLLPKALLALAAVAAFLECRSQALLGWLAAGLVVALTLGNWARLGAMAWSAEMFELTHGPIGANIFDLFQTSIILTAGLVLCRR